MSVWSNREKARRAMLVTIAVVVLVALAGCAETGGGNATVDQQTPEPTPERTPEPTDTPVDSTPEPTAPPETKPGTGGGDDGSNDTAMLFLVGGLLVVAVGLVAAGVLRRRNRPRQTGVEPEPDARSDPERVISLLHRNNGRVFEDVLQEELDWSPAHTRRVLDGLVATGDVELEATDRGTLVVFSEA